MIIHQKFIQPPMMFHGGNLQHLESEPQAVKVNSNYGPGLYLTSHYEHAARYGRQMYRVALAPETTILTRQSEVDIQSLVQWSNAELPKAKASRILSHVTPNEKGMVGLELFFNRILLDGSVSPTVGQRMQMMMRDFGIDASAGYIGGRFVIAVFNPARLTAYKISGITPAQQRALSQELGVPLFDDADPETLKMVLVGAPSVDHDREDQCSYAPTA